MPAARAGPGRLQPERGFIGAGGGRRRLLSEAGLRPCRRRRPTSQRARKEGGGRARARRRRKLSNRTPSNNVEGWRSARLCLLPWRRCPTVSRRRKRDRGPTRRLRDSKPRTSPPLVEMNVHSSPLRPAPGRTRERLATVTGPRRRAGVIIFLGTSAFSKSAAARPRGRSRGPRGAAGRVLLLYDDQSKPAGVGARAPRGDVAAVAQAIRSDVDDGTRTRSTRPSSRRAVRMS